jgi:RimJ/RimL family protein N-acetyltransferase
MPGESNDETTIIETGRLVLTPLRIADAIAMADVLGHQRLYEFTGGEPPTVEQLELRYGAQVAGSSNPAEVWHNWIVRLVDSGVAVGYVQATVMGTSADVAWVIGVDWQHRGIAREASMAMCRWLHDAGVDRITAHIHPDHAASSAIAEACGLQRTTVIDDDGEVVWESADQS